VMGPGVAGECVETKDGLVVWEDHFYPEIVDPESGRVLPDGEAGELVMTSLTKEAMPVVRYRTRDRTRLLPGTARSMRRLERLSGRTDDLLIIRGVNVFPSQIEELIVGAKHFSPHYQLEVRRVQRLDRIEIVVEPRDASIDDATAADGAKALVHHVKSLIGISCQVRVEPRGTIPRSAGKAKRVIDYREQSRGA